MALTQEQVDWWFSQNPTATADQVADAVKAAGGLDANAGLADMIAKRYAIDTNQVTDYYNNYAPVTGGLNLANDAGAAVTVSGNTGAITNGATTSGLSNLTTDTTSNLGSTIGATTGALTQATTGDTTGALTQATTGTTGTTGSDVTTVSGGAGTDTTSGLSTLNIPAAVTNPYDAISAAWGRGDYAATNKLIADTGLTAKDIQSHYNLDDATMNWVLSQGIKTADTGTTVSTGSSVSTSTGGTGTSTTSGLSVLNNNVTGSTASTLTGTSTGTDDLSFNRGPDTRTFTGTGTSVSTGTSRSNITRSGLTGVAGQMSKSLLRRC